MIENGLNCILKAISGPTPRIDSRLRTVFPVRYVCELKDIVRRWGDEVEEVLLDANPRIRVDKGALKNSFIC